MLQAHPGDASSTPSSGTTASSKLGSARSGCGRVSASGSCRGRSKRSRQAVRRGQGDGGPAQAEARIWRKPPDGPAAPDHPQGRAQRHGVRAACRRPRRAGAAGLRRRHGDLLRPQPRRGGSATTAETVHCGNCGRAGGATGAARRRGGCARRGATSLRAPQGTRAARRHRARTRLRAQGRGRGRGRPLRCAARHAERAWPAMAPRPRGAARDQRAGAGGGDVRRPIPRDRPCHRPRDRARGRRRRKHRQECRQCAGTEACRFCAPRRRAAAARCGRGGVCAAVSRSAARNAPAGGRRGPRDRAKRRETEHRRISTAPWSASWRSRTCSSMRSARTRARRARAFCHSTRASPSPSALWPAPRSRR